MAAAGFGHSPKAGFSIVGILAAAHADAGLPRMFAIQVYYRGQWGTICDDFFTTASKTRLCTFMVNTTLSSAPPACLASCATLVRALLNPHASPPASAACAAVASLACRQLGFAHGAPVRWAAFGQGTGPIWMDNVQCLGGEQRIWDCDAERPNRECTHSGRQRAIWAGEGAGGGVHRQALHTVPCPRSESWGHGRGDYRSLPACLPVCGRRATG